MTARSDAATTLKCGCSVAVKGLFFDLGGTLFRYSRPEEQIGALLVDSIRALPGGAQLDPQAVGTAYGQAGRAVASDYARRDYYLHSDLFRDIYRTATVSLGLDFDQQAYADYRSHHHQAVVDGLSLKPDCLETLTALKARGLYLSIVSNIDEDMLHPLVAREGLDQLLDHWTSSEAAQSCKPHRRFFDLTLAKSGLPADSVLFVGDSPEHDVNGAAAVGMRTVLIKNGDQPPPLQSGVETLDPDHTIDELQELLHLV